MDDMLNDERAAQILTDNVGAAIAALLGQPDPRVVNTPSGITEADGEQPPLPEPWNDDEDGAP